MSIVHDELILAAALYGPGFHVTCDATQDEFLGLAREMVEKYRPKELVLRLEPESGPLGNDLEQPELPVGAVSREG